MRKTYFLGSLLIFLMILAIILSPQKYIFAFSVGLETWAKILLPTLFPLIFFTKLLSDLGVLNNLSSKINFTQKMFLSPPISSYAFMVSILSGYPVGAKVVSDLYTDGYITKKDAIKMCTFTSNSGPMFIYGSVGIGMLGSKTLGLIMLISHIFSAICNGLLYRKYKVPNTPPNSFQLVTKPKFSLSESMTDAILSILLIGGFVSVFFVIIQMLTDLQVFETLSITLSNILGIDKNIFLSVFNGLIEMTHGCLDLSKLNISVELTTVLCTGIITFGGLATMLQAFAFLQKIGISFKFFVLQKITQTIFACVICSLLIILF